MRQKQSAEYRVGVGAPVILMILVVVSLTVLSLLSWISARFDANYSQRNIDMTTAYYEAAVQVQQSLMELDGQLKAAYQQSDDSETYDQKLAGLGMDENRMIVWEVDAKSDRSLIAEIYLSEYDQADRQRYELRAHWLRDDYEWSEEQTRQIFGA